MAKVRVLVANRPRLMRELVLATISDQPDIEILGEIKDDSELVEVVAESRPDFVIIALDATEKRPDICDVLLKANPQLGILPHCCPLACSARLWHRRNGHGFVVLFALPG